MQSLEDQEQSFEERQDLAMEQPDPALLENVEVSVLGIPDTIGTWT